MVTIIEQQGDILGRLGKGFGKGLAEQLPKEVSRYRLSKGLEDFEKNSAGKTPFQQAVEFYKIPETTPEMGYTLFPLLRQQQQAEAAKSFGNEPGMPREGRGEPQRVAPRGTPTEVRGPIPGKEKETFPEEQRSAEQQGTIKPIESSRALTEPIVRKSPEQINAEAAQEFQARPGFFQTHAEAVNFANERENTRLANLQQQQQAAAQQEAISSNLEQKLKSRWEKEKTIGDGSTERLPDEVQQLLQDSMKTEFANPNNKLSEDAIVKKYGEVGKNLAKKITTLDTKSKKWWWDSDASPESVIKSIDTLRPSFEKLGPNGLETFQKLIAAKFKTGEAVSSYFTYPLQEKSKEFVNNEKKLPPLKTVSLPTPYGDTLPLPEQADLDRQRKASIKAADKVGDYLSDNDSLYTIALSLKQKGYDPKVFFDRVEQNLHQGLLKLSEKQERELSNGYPKHFSLGDYYMAAKLKKDEMVEE